MQRCIDNIGSVAAKGVRMVTYAHHVYWYVVISLIWGGANEVYAFAGGRGEPNDPYRIATAEQLISIGSDPNLLDKHFVLLNDIDLDPNLPGGRVFVHAVIAPDTGPAKEFQGIAFTGNFDGRDHVIKNLVIRGDADYLGLFGVLGRPAVVKNVRIEAAHLGERYGQYHGALAGWNGGHIVHCRVEGYVYGGARIGGVVGQNQGDLFGCHADGDAVSSDNNVGGVVGHNHFSARVMHCSATGRVVIGREWAGGLVGSNEGYIAMSHAVSDVLAVGYGVNGLGGLVGYCGNSSMIINCYAAGNISAWEWAVDSGFGQAGGLVGMVDGGSIVNCYATGRVSGTNKSRSVGGLVGRILYGSVVNAYASGRISAGGDSTHLGGLVGDRAEATIVRASFWNMETSGRSESEGGTGLTTQQMQDMQTFLAAGWDFVGEWSNGSADVWLMPEGGQGPTLAILADRYEPPGLVGSGTADDPYRIGTPGHLGAVWHHNPSACYQLVADIDLSGMTWGIAPIPYFSGRFDGAGHTISHLRILGARDLGLFAYVATEAALTGLTVREVDIAGEEEAKYVGILAARNDGEITACHTVGCVSIEGAALQLGGLVGLNDVGMVSNCDAIAAISCGGRAGAIGGLVGNHRGGTITGSYAISQVASGIGSTGLGGLVGANGARITSSYADGRISGGDESRALGGLIGWNEGDVADCYAAGGLPYSQKLEAAGLIGRNYDGMIHNCYSIGSLVGTQMGAGSTTQSFFLAPPADQGLPSMIGVPLTDEQMKRRASFTGWDFENTWTIREGKDYPRLRWQNVKSEK